MAWRDSGRHVLAACIGLLISAGAQAGDDSSSEPVVAPKPAPASAAVLLKYQFEPNQILRYRVNFKSSIRLQKGRVTNITKTDSTTHNHLRVISLAAASLATVETTIDRVQANVQF